MAEPAKNADSGSRASNAILVSYTSPTNEPFTKSIAIPAPLSDSVADKTTYLKALREATTSIQDHINKELTARMAEDKAKELAQDPTAAKKSTADEEKEEENYGEEVAEEDE